MRSRRLAYHKLSPDLVLVADGPTQYLRKRHASPLRAAQPGGTAPTIPVIRRCAANILPQPPGVAIHQACDRVRTASVEPSTLAEARHNHAEHAEIDRLDRDVFDAGKYAFDELIKASNLVEFDVLVIGREDVTT